MSYILRALKKSQQERDRGSVPKLTRAPEPAPGRERKLWPWWLAGALAVNVVAVAGGLWWFDSGSEPGKMTSGEACSQSTVADSSSSTSTIADINADSACSTLSSDSFRSGSTSNTAGMVAARSIASA